MKPQPGYYSLIQYCPDAARSEAVNVGVALLCPGLNFLDAALTDNPERAVRLFGKDAVQPQALRAAKEAIKARLTQGSDRPMTLEDFQKFIDTCANDIVLTNPRPMKLLREAPLELASLFEQLVERRVAKRTRVGRLAPELEEMFRTLVHEGRAADSPGSHRTAHGLDQVVHVDVGAAGGVGGRDLDDEPGLGGQQRRQGCAIRLPRGSPAGHQLELLRGAAAAATEAQPATAGIEGRIDGDGGGRAIGWRHG